MTVRYIDADALEHECKYYDTVDDLERYVKKHGYADVVPKSEVEKLQIEIEALKIANEKMYAANKAQAREIFEEIDSGIAEQYPIYSAESIIKLLDALKKKYTEEKT